MRRLVAAALSLAVSTWTGCPSGPPAPPRPIVVVSVPPQASFVERIAGDLVELDVMIPPAASHASYEPTLRQMKAVSRASVYVKVGHPSFSFERAWLDRLLGESPGLRVIDGSAGIERKAGDPHVWVSPRSVRRMARNIAAGMAQELPEHRATFEANLRSFLEEVDRVDADLRSVLKSRRVRALLVFHPAWGYLAEDYGLEQLAIEEEGKEPSPGRLAQLIARARSEGLRVVLVQPQFSPAAAELVAQEIGATVVSVDPFARDWLGSMRTLIAALHSGGGRVSSRSASRYASSAIAATLRSRSSLRTLSRVSASVWW
jgi:zinc transport system substrate-binding protein